MNEIQIIIFTAWYLLIGVGCNKMESYRDQSGPVLRRAFFICLWPMVVVWLAFLLGEKE